MRWFQRWSALTFSASIFISACQHKRVENPVSEENLISHIVDSTHFEEVFPDVVSAHIKIVPTMNSDFSDVNTVHCANIEYLWNALIGNSDKSISKNLLVNEFNHSRSWKNAIDTSNLVLAFGKPGDVYENIIRQYKTKYKINKNDLSPPGGTFWGYTDKVVNYKYAEPFDEQRLMFLGTEVSAFGFNSGFSSTYSKEYFKGQFDILYFDNDGEFVVKLKPASTTDEIILAMVKHGSFLKMFSYSKQLIKKGIDKMKHDALIYNLNTEDELVIPVIRFKASRNYSELQGLKISSTYGPIDLFEQVISFNFDRKGVALEAGGSMADSVGVPQKPKILRYDKPFYLYIKEANASHPYFNLWVSDPDILERKQSIN